MSSITRLRTSPKNREELMDFALAGPWAGIAASSIALMMGLDLTIGASPESAAYFPALPTSFLQASSLIASVVDSALPNSNILATGIDPATPVYLHPLAIAGYAGLMLNALNLTPFGRTDGGRIALSMFGRSGAQILSLITLITLLLAGFVGNDSFLTYFLFVSFFQGELEIPMRDESDPIDASRIVLGLVTAAFVLLTLIPV
jgi:membrane-associated protease RseP (regulator of RpoE activity)